MLFFYGAKIGGNISFAGAKIGKSICDISDAKIGRLLNFENAKCGNLSSQEELCRIAKTIQENRGDKFKADYYFYHEMETKRTQKPFYKRYSELIVQYCFGYGVYPKRLVITWFAIVIPLAFIYWFGNGVQDANTIWANLYFSVITALTPGYSGYKPINSIYQIIATGEAVFGAFMWAIFIATFARKFMK